MSTTIAISGKGGSGKTTVAALLVRALRERAAGPVLAVDADPNACLGDALGVEVETTLGQIRDAALDRRLQPGPGADRERAVQFAIHRAVAEAEGFDLLTMGHTEGPRCYCAVNHLLRRYLDQAAEDYAWVVLDNEAGMEHLSRQTTNDVDLLLVVAEPTPIGATTARRILGLADRLPVTVRRRAVLWNKVRDPSRLPALQGRATGRAAPRAGRVHRAGRGSGRSPSSSAAVPNAPDATEPAPTSGLLWVPLDPAVARLWDGGGTVFDLPAEAPALRAVADLLAAFFDPETAHPADRTGRGNGTGPGGGARPAASAAAPHPRPTSPEPTAPPTRLAALVEPASSPEPAASPELAAEAAGQPQPPSPPPSPSGPPRPSAAPPGTAAPHVAPVGTTPGRVPTAEAGPREARPRRATDEKEPQSEKKRKTDDPGRQVPPETRKNGPPGS